LEKTYFKMTVIRIKICRQTGPYGRVPQNRFWFVPNCEQGIGWIGIDKRFHDLQKYCISILFCPSFDVFVSGKALNPAFA